MDFLYSTIGTFINFFYGITMNAGLSVVMFAGAVKLIMIPMSNKFYTKIFGYRKSLTEQFAKFDEKYGKNTKKIADEKTKMMIQLKYPLMGETLHFVVYAIIVIGLLGAVNNPASFIPDAGAGMSDKFLFIDDMNVSFFNAFSRFGFGDASIVYLLFPAIAFVLNYYHGKILREYSIVDYHVIEIITLVALSFLSLLLPNYFALFWSAYRVFAIANLFIIKKHAQKHPSEIKLNPKSDKQQKNKKYTKLK